MYPSRLSLIVLLFSVLSVSAANAATVTKFGNDVSFTFDNSSLYGDGFVVGNSIFFSPTNFLSTSTDGTAPVLVTETLNITIDVLDKPSFTLDAISVVESGDYVLDGAGASVSASLRTQVTSLTWIHGGLPATNTVLSQTGNITSPQDGSTNLWNITNVNEWGWENEKTVIFQLQNNLIADTDAEGELAFIQKKAGFVGITVNPSPIPLPASLLLIGSALLGLLGFKQKLT